MTEQEFIAAMKNEVLFTNNDLSLDMPLEDIEEWDSMGIVSFIAMAKESGCTRVNRDAVNDAKTVGDLFSLVQG